LAPTLKPVEASFLQGLLDNIHAISAFSLPTAASYARMVDGVWSGGTYVCWGTENREAPIRLCGPQGSHNFELKCVDGTSSPYLLLAAIIAAGIDGVRNKKQLKVGDCLEVAADIGVERRSELGISENRLPLKIEEARKYLKNSEVMKQYLGNNLIEKYISANEVCALFV
jgi:glutamine synthetase